LIINKKINKMTNRLENSTLYPVPKEGCSLWMDEIGGVMGLGQEGTYEIDPDKVKVEYPTPKLRSSDAQSAIALRRKRFEEGGGKIQNNNYLTITRTPYLNKAGEIVIKRELSDFPTWHFSKFMGDGLDGEFALEDRDLSFYISVFPITSDGKIIIPNRTDKRVDYKGLFCFTGGYGREKDIPHNLLTCESEMLKDGTGNGLIRQIEMVPVDQYGLGSVEEAEKYVKESKLLGMLATSTRTSGKVRELGHHLAGFAKLNIDSQQIIETANEKYRKDNFGRFVEIGKQNVFENDPEPLVDFANEMTQKYFGKGDEKSPSLAPTLIPLIWLAIANQFGGKYLDKIEGLERN